MFFIRERPRLTRDFVFLRQIEFSRTQVFDRSLSGRLFFEQMLRDNLDLGRPDKLPLIFDMSIPRTTKTQFRPANGCDFVDAR